MELDATGIDCNTVAIPQIVVECSTSKIKLWRWRNRDDERGPVPRYVMGAIGLNSAVLKQYYVVLQEDEKGEGEPEQPAPLRLFEETIHLVRQTCDLMLLELSKSPEKERPNWYNNIMNERSREAFGWKNTEVPET